MTAKQKVAVRYRNAVSNVFGTMVGMFAGLEKNKIWTMWKGVWLVDRWECNIWCTSEPGNPGTNAQNPTGSDLESPRLSHL